MHVCVYVCKCVCIYKYNIYNIIIYNYIIYNDILFTYNDMTSLYIT